ncbi:hypothetical protein [Pseudovibrio sp. Tun.PSC04-5.I4]|uniref:hypothetical protein n=1 Tax=Pseudovibrio sp. Tun.PSC04-5.I4 TaxID=1798213 RepID=UPI0008842A9D|nr:hypothetical protein [Pseudovibrio sp. Tun.PSC04-5.I4]SDR15933.1 hypothetical protein SAMN04515695_3084 [Pseudovibrio sp. Tun.PSC04-5.I4]SDR40362.1 hypothetical protein SAMN04515695_5421 [Pseudovibrio sp. Tun.PSC04-5.I4]
MLSGLLKELRALFLISRCNEVMDPEAHDLFAQTLLTGTELAEQLERLAKSKMTPLEDAHFNDPKIVIFPTLSRDPKCIQKGNDHDT